MKSDDAFSEFNTAISTLSMPTLEGPTPPTIFICGTPRSGTTYLYQLLSFVGDVGYISNLVARFAENPLLGIRLSQALNLTKIYSGISKFGLTHDLSEPHEFGKGWSHILTRNAVLQPDPHAPLSSKSVGDIEQIARTFDLPTVFKSFAYQWSIDELSQALPNSYWIWIQRDTAEAALSLQGLYRERGSDLNPQGWESAVLSATRKKKEFSGLDDKCLAQIQDMHDYLEDKFTQLPNERSFVVSLDDLAANPKMCVSEILTYFGIDAISGALDQI